MQIQDGQFVVCGNPIEASHSRQTALRRTCTTGSAGDRREQPCPWNNA